MSLDVAPPTLFRASAIAAAGVPWLADGFHLRVKLNPWIGFPIHPFAAWRLGFDEELTELPIQWRDSYGNALTVPFDLEQTGGFAEGSLFGYPAADPCIWAEVDVDDRGLRVDLLDALHATAGGARVLATRRSAPFRFGHTRVARLQASGAGTVSTAWGLRQTSVLQETAIADRPPDLVFGLPLPPGPWYAPDSNTDPLGAAAERVALAAPRRLNPPDNPDGRLPNDTDPDAETRRIVERIAPEYVDPWLQSGWYDPDLAPAHATFSDSVTGADNRPVKATAAITPSLSTMAVDPQIARYLGLATTVPFSATAPIQRANVWVVAGRWAVQRERTLHPSSDQLGAPLTLGDVLGPPASGGWADGLLDGVFPEAPQLIGDLAQRPGGEDGPWSGATLFAVAVAAGDAPPDPPDPFQLAAAEPGQWNPSADPDDPGPESWRQPVSLGAQPARGMVGFARTGPDGPVALHRFAPPQAQGYVTRALPLVPNWAANNQRVVEDRTVPADPAGASWRVWGADEFGQWSDGAELGVPLPMRPAPPAPVLEATFRAEPADGSNGPRVPGTLRLRYTAPDPGSAAPGSLPIVELRVGVDGEPSHRGRSIPAKPSSSKRHQSPSMSASAAAYGSSPPTWTRTERRRLRPRTIAPSTTLAPRRSFPPHRWSCGPDRRTRPGWLSWPSAGRPSRMPTGTGSISATPAASPANSASPSPSPRSGRRRPTRSISPVTSSQQRAPSPSSVRPGAPRPMMVSSTSPPVSPAACAVSSSSAWSLSPPAAPRPRSRPAASSPSPSPSRTVRRRRSWMRAPIRTSDSP